MDKIILATDNKHKVLEFSRILAPLGVEVISKTDAGVLIEVEETAETFAGNAYLKAKAVYDKAHLPVMADDSGIIVDALNGDPGVYSARYGGEGLNDVDRYKLVLKNLKDVPEEKRTARFVCAISLILSDEQYYTFTGICEGKIAFEAAGGNGFGYDPIFLAGNPPKCLSIISNEEKDAISHRGAAIKQMLETLKELTQEQIGQEELKGN